MPNDDSVLKEFVMTTHDLIFGPPGPHVSKAEQKAWDEVMRSKLHVMLPRAKLALGLSN